jgi:predicted permease
MTTSGLNRHTLTSHHVWSRTHLPTSGSVSQRDVFNFMLPCILFKSFRKFINNNPRFSLNSSDVRVFLSVLSRSLVY